MATIIADNRYLNIPCETLADLKAVSTTLKVNGVLIKNAALGLFYFDRNSTATPDDVKVVKPNDVILPASGRWIKFDESLLQRTGTVLSPKIAGDSFSLPGSGELLDLGTTTNASTPAIVLKTNNSGFASPSDVNTTSNGDKWVFWNASTYKGAIGFDSFEMWFQSTSTVAGINNKFRFYSGQANSPVDLLKFGTGNNLGFVWNDTGLPLNFRAEGDTDPNLFYLNGGTNQVCLGTVTPITNAKLTINGTLGASSLNTLNGIVQTSDSGLFSSNTALPNGTTATTQSSGDNSTKIATTEYVDNSIPVAYEEYSNTLTISSDGQTAFTLSQSPVENGSFKLFVNGVLQTTYTRIGTALTWLNTYYVLQTTDSLIAIYSINNGYVNTKFVEGGTASTMGTITLTGSGSYVVNTTAVKSNSVVLLTTQQPIGNSGIVKISTRVVGTSFTISAQGGDASKIGWVLFNS